VTTTSGLGGSGAGSEAGFGVSGAVWETTGETTGFGEVCKHFEHPHKHLVNEQSTNKQKINNMGAGVEIG